MTNWEGVCYTDTVVNCFVLLFQYFAGGAKSLGQGNHYSARNSKLKISEYKVKMQITRPRLCQYLKTNLTLRCICSFGNSSVVAKFVILPCLCLFFGENFCYHLRCIGVSFALKQFASKFCYLYNKLQEVISHKCVMFIFNAIKTSNLTRIFMIMITIIISSSSSNSSRNNNKNNRVLMCCLLCHGNMEGQKWTDKMLVLLNACDVILDGIY